MVCVDTDILINLLRGDKNAEVLIKKIEKSNELNTTVINAFELWKGVYRAKNDEQKTSELLRTLPILKLEEKSSKKAAEIFEYLRKKGKTVDALDIMIASIAMVNNESLLTFNKKHFENIPNLELI